MAAAVHHMVMACAKDRAAGACVRVHHPSCQEEGDQEHGWVRGPRPGHLGPGVTHLRQLATAVLNGAHRGWGCVHRIKRQWHRRAATSGLRALEGGASELGCHGSNLFWESLSARGLPR